MPANPPRLGSTVPDNQQAYAPLSWTAVASLVVAILYFLMMLWMGYSALSKNHPLIEPWLLFFPALAIVLAFVARRQIRISEGTKAGEEYAIFGWWIAVIGGLGYFAYLGAIDYSIRLEAKQQFAGWSAHLNNLNQTDPRDPDLFAALHMALPPGERTAFSPKDVEAIERTRETDLLSFRSSDIVRICARNRGKNEFQIQGLKDWQLKPKVITCALTATMINPEGEFSLVIPMQAVIIDNKFRRWQIMPAPNGYIITRNLTRYGWQVERLDESAREYSREFLSVLATPEQTRLAYLGFIRPGLTADNASSLIGQLLIVGGGLTTTPPLFPGWLNELNKSVFAKPTGQLVADDLPRFHYLWNSPRRIVPAGLAIRNNPDNNPVIVTADQTIEARVPIEFVLAGDPPAATVSRGRLVLQLSANADPQFFSDFSQGRNTSTGAKSERPIQDVITRKIPWRVVRLETDFIPVKMPSPQQMGMGDGPPG